ncbi:MAG: oxidoreductase, partial [Actinomycetota bacterium]
LAPIKTQSRIDVPRIGERVPAGRFRLAGVAWATHTGIERVEVRIDEGEWQVAELSRDVSNDTWRQWVLDWDATPGEHRVTVRATDRSGYVQTSEQRAPAPDGATGWHSRKFTVTD